MAQLNATEWQHCNIEGLKDKMTILSALNPITKKGLNTEQQLRTTAGKKGEATRDCGRVGPGLLEVVV